jgi:hypothetical protein
MICEIGNSMLEPTLITWILVVFGIVFILLPMLYVQLMVVLRPQSQRTKDIVIGKGEEYRDKTHFRMSYGMAWADLLFWLPFLLAGSIGVLTGEVWGYILWAISGAISVYINIQLWFSEREYVYPKTGFLAYYTYYWGFFIYWGLATLVYSLYRLVYAT